MAKVEAMVIRLFLVDEVAPEPSSDDTPPLQAAEEMVTEPSVGS
jgi:hypothetical protein